MNSPPTSHNGIPPALIKAYRLARYEFTHNNDTVRLSVSRASQILQAIMANAGVRTAAWLTAFNPASVLRDDDQNAQAQQELEQSIIAGGYAFLKGQGISPEGQRAAEDSALILGMPQHTVDALADQYDQNAYLWVNNADAFVSLRLRKPLQVPPANELAAWRNGLPPEQAAAAHVLHPVEQAWLMSVMDAELAHWLPPAQRDLNQLWPLVKPDGSAMGAGTELDRMCRLIAAGL